MYDTSSNEAMMFRGKLKSTFSRVSKSDREIKEIFLKDKKLMREMESTQLI